MSLENAQNMRIVAIIQARMGSTRLPRKVLKQVRGKPLLGYQIERVRRAKYVDDIVVATTQNSEDQAIIDFCLNEKVAYYRGSEEDVLQRYAETAKIYKADAIVRLTADCPLIDPQVIDDVIKEYRYHFPDYDYVSNFIERTFPRGMDVEIFSYQSLLVVEQEAKKPEEREHVTLYYYRYPHQFKMGSVVQKNRGEHYRLTVDTDEDFTLISRILEFLYPNHPSFTMNDVIDLLQKHPDLVKINANVKQKKL